MSIKIASGNAHPRLLVGNFGHPWLEVFDGVVSDVTDSAAVEFRQSFDRGIADRFQSLFQHIQRIDIAVRRSRSRLNHLIWLGSQERVSGDMLTALYAFEEEGVRAAGDLDEGRYRRFEVGGYLSIYRYEVVAFVREAFEGW